MNQEIERKFLVNKPLNEILDLYSRTRIMEIEQRYLLKCGDWTTRIRCTTCNYDTTYWLTLKKKISDVSCIELETEIDVTFYNSVAEHCGPALEKIRHEINLAGETWEIDVFTHPVFEGLVVAEIELKSEEDFFFKPHWLGEEVTYDKQYKNVKMVKRLSDTKI